MGARINYIFKNNEGPHVVLYSHWGETEWQRDLAMALNHARPRWGDKSYCTRMILSYLIQDSVLEETGFGIYAINDISRDLGDTTVIIDINQETVIEDGNKVDWDLFIQAYGPKILAEQAV
jgi:hypothetical protein